MIDPQDVGPLQRPVVVFDPAVGGGRATMRGIHTEAIAEAYWAENGDEQAVCTNYGLSRYELATALWYEGTYGDARTEYAGWQEWADEVAHPRLASFKPLDLDTLELPPGCEEA